MVKVDRRKPQKTDIELEINEYEPSEDSDDDYDSNERLMLQQAAKRRAKLNDEDEESEEEVFGIHDSEDDEDETEVVEPLGDEMDSDIEGKEDDDGLPDSKAWGTKKKSYYNTDYVDQDYGGFSKAEEEEEALLEEEEARAIQTRLIAELEDVDLDLGILTSQKSQKKEKSAVLEEEDFSEVIKTDVSQMSKREKLDLLAKESPEFMGLVSDFKERMMYARDNLEPILSLVKTGEIPDCQAVKFVYTKYHVTLNYCTNIVFYLLLKSKRVRVVSHPVVKRLVQYRKLLEGMDPIDENIIQPQVKEIVLMKEKGKRLKLVTPKAPTTPAITGNRAQRRKMLQQMAEEDERVKKPKFDSFEEMQLQEDVDANDDEEEEFKDDTGKRKITYEIAKNKGLTPKRKKENRNPRVKHRNKFNKAIVRRKGQVRGVYKENTRYGGEPFGIKASVSKSIKLK